MLVMIWLVYRNGTIYSGGTQWIASFICMSIIVLARGGGCVIVSIYMYTHAAELRSEDDIKNTIKNIIWE